MPGEITQEKEMSFAELLEAGGTERKFYKPGQRIEAKVVKVTPEWIFIDLGEKNEGYVERKELNDEKGNVSVVEGDIINVYFLKSEHNEKRFTTKITSAAAGKNFLEDAWRGSIPVEGKVESEVKGGYQIRLGGGVRGFCPFSQISLRSTEDSQNLLGQTLLFTISEFKNEGRNVVLSRRKILEEEERSKKETLKASLHEGDMITGTVVGIEKFGAFVDLGGLQGLIPLSEMDWDRSKKISDLLALGQLVTVKILKLDWERERVTLSLRETKEDPWVIAEEKYLPGSIHRGTVARLADFGAFVTMEGGIDGLLHISQLGKGKRIKHPREVLKEGQTLDVQVEKVEKGNKRISLVLPQLEADEEENPVEYRGSLTKSMGTLGDILQQKMKGRKRG